MTLQLRFGFRSAMIWIGLATAVGEGSAATTADTLHVRPGDDLQRVLEETPLESVVLLEKGDHQGPVIVRHTLTLVGEAGARILGSGRGSVVVIEAVGVRITGFEIRGSGRDLARDDAGVLIVADSVVAEHLHLRDNLHGIYVRGARGVRILANEIFGLTSGGGSVPPADRAANGAPGPHMDHAHEGGMNPARLTGQSLTGNGIHLWSADGAVVERNRIRAGRDGIYVAHTDGSRFVDNHIRETRYGIHYMYSQGNRIEGNRLARNVAGAALMFSRDLEVTGNVFVEHAGARAYGLLLQDVESSRIHRNELRGNRVGLRLQSSAANALTHNRITGNATGVTLGSASPDNRFSRNRIASNLRNVGLTGPVPPGDWAVDGVGNAWGGALPMDLTGDGISEWPHHETDLFGARRESFPALQLLAGSPGIRLLEWALGQVPVRGTRYVTDPRPLTPGGGARR